MSTPVAYLIKPFIERAFAERPDLVVDNRTASCGALLMLAQGYAGPDWAYVGKTSGGESGFVPLGFVPMPVTVIRPDGQAQEITIVKVSMDALWHLPTKQQVKVIANSTANELPEGDPRRGPAKIGAYDIDPADYRWNNPPVTMAGSAPTPTPKPPAVPAFPPRDQVVQFGLELNAHYANKGASANGTLGGKFGGQQRYVDVEGEIVWLSEYLRRRQLGESQADATAHVLADVDAAWPK